jgi:hypothetical protein
MSNRVEIAVFFLLDYLNTNVSILKINDRIETNVTILQLA